MNHLVSQEVLHDSYQQAQEKKKIPQSLGKAQATNETTKENQEGILRNIQKLCKLASQVTALSRVRSDWRGMERKGREVRERLYL